MSDPNWQPTQPGDPGAPRDVNRPEDVVWDGVSVPGNPSVDDTDEVKPARKATKATKSTAKTENEAA